MSRPLNSGRVAPVCDAPAAPLVLVDNRSYTDRWGQVFTIMGATHHYPALVWALSGTWFERATGRRVINWTDAGPVLSEPDNWETLAEEVLL